MKLKSQQLCARSILIIPCWNDSILTIPWQQLKPLWLQSTVSRSTTLSSQVHRAPQSIGSLAKYAAMKWDLTSECSKLKKRNLSHPMQSGSDHPSFTGIEQVQCTLHSCSEGSEGTAAEPLKPGGRTLLFQEKLHLEEKHQQLQEMRLPFFPAMLSSPFPTRKNRPEENEMLGSHLQGAWCGILSLHRPISNYPFPASTPFSWSSINNDALHSCIRALSAVLKPASDLVRSGLTY